METTMVNVDSVNYVFPHLNFCLWQVDLSTRHIYHYTVIMLLSPQELDHLMICYTRS